MPRPTKFHKFFEKMREVVEDPRSVTLTDTELWIATNNRLKPKDRVAESTFKTWKSNGNQDSTLENIESVSQEEIEDFRQVLGMSRVEQKMNLTGAMLDEKNKNQWGASWILERKFNDLKLNPKVSLGEGTTNIQINVSNNEHKGMIEDILSGTLEAPNDLD